ncbi:MAG: hypothetical protein GX091_04275 [Peptococcaceae bacterium]|nr:hypothetical protein [Peptococcaceae bacterium]
MSQIYKTAILALVLMNLIETLTGADLTPAIFIIAVIIVLFGIPFIGRSFKIITIIFFLAGLAILIWCKLPLDAWMTAFNSMTGLICILTVMQLFTIPIEVGKYNLAVGHLLKRICRGEGRLYLFITLITNIFSCILSMGSVPIVFSLIEDTAKKRITNYKRFIATSISRGFSLSTLWAPGAATIFLVGQVTGVVWSRIFFPGLFLALIGITISSLLELKRYKGSPLNQGLETEILTCEEKRKAGQKVWHIAWAIVLVILLTMIFIRLKIGASSSAVVLSGILVFLVWTFLLGKNFNIKGGISNYWHKGVLKAADLAPFFVAIGVFSGAFQKSYLAVLLEQSLQGVAHGLGLFAVILIPLSIMVLALVGLHPFISVVLLGQILMTLQLPLPAITLALCLNLGSSIAYMVSPFAGIIMTMAKFTDSTAVDVAIRWNWLFSTIYFVIGISLAYFLGMICPYL